MQKIVLWLLLIQLFISAYMDLKTMSVSFLLLLHMLVLTIVTGIVTGISPVAYFYGNMYFLLGKIGVFGMADAYVFCVVIGMIHFSGGNVVTDIIIVFFVSQLCFVIYAIITAVKTGLKFKLIKEQRLPMIPSITVSVCLYLLWRGVV